MLLLAGTGVLGIKNGITEWKDAITPLQKSVTGGVFLYGILGLVGAVGLATRRRWGYLVAMAWGVVVTYVAGAAVMAYAPDGTWGAALTGSVATALIAGAVVWAARSALSATAAGASTRR